ncbi:MAG: hypothetical protein KatS3mg015_2195 [Fimbriimonadales bacterium]|nr:MAG: hypothetical protein KatS3mg015_2195 [Fimbriimonadales bacterium]
MSDWDETINAMADWLGWVPSEHWRDYYLSVVLASDVENDRMLLEFDVYKIVARGHAPGFGLAHAYFDKITKRDIFAVEYAQSQDAVINLEWTEHRDSLLACNLNLVIGGLPVLSCSDVGGCQSVRFYRDGVLVGMVRVEPLVALLDDFYVNQSDRVEE